MTVSNNALSSYWMPFTSNRDFKAAPRLISKADGHYYYSKDGRKLYDSFSGLWTTGIGHCHPKIVSAVKQQLEELDYAMSFQAAHPKAFELANQLSDLAPAGLSHVFFTNSGSESADTALKIALAYHRANGEPTRTKFVGRERGYHGVNFGGMSVGGIGANRQAFASSLLPGVDHLPHTWQLEKNSFAKGCPPHGVELASELEKICALHGPGNVAAVIVEPVAGSTGVLPPPEGYLKELRAITERYGILLIFDEVITAFGRVGDAFASDRFGVTPDLITTAKGLTNGVIPMGGVIIRDEIHDAIVQGPAHAVEFFHGYTYSGHPVATAAALATLEAYEEEGAFQEARELETCFEDAIHSLKGHSKVIDIRNFGLMGAIELAPGAEGVGVRGLSVHKQCFWEEDLVIRNGGDILQFSPFLNSKPSDIAMTFDKVRRVLDRVE